MSGVNGHNLGGGPLHLSTPQRVALLKKIGLAQGWMLLTVAEMFDMKKAMDGATAENERLNKQTARLMSAWISDQSRAVQALEDAKATLKLFAEAPAGAIPPALRIDAVNSIAKLDAALKTFIESPKVPEGKEESDDGRAEQQPAG